MPFAIVGGALALGGSLISSGTQADASQNASNTQAASTAQALQEQQREYDLTRSDYAPYRAAGTQALGELQTAVDTTPTADQIMADDPGYQFGLQQGQQAIDRKTAAQGGRVSGAAIKAAARYGTDYATTGYSAAYARRQDRLNRLATLAGIGQTATGSGAAAGAASTNAISGLLTSGGDAAAAGALARGNIYGNAINQSAASFGSSNGSGGLLNSLNNYFNTDSYNQIASSGDRGGINPITYSDNYGN